MQVSTEKKEGLKYLLNVTLSKEEFGKAYADNLKKVSKKARIDGFRKGHIPLQILESRFGPDILTGAMDDLIEKTIGNAIKESKLEEKMAGRPSVDVKKFPSKDSEFNYEITLEVHPELEFKPLEDLKVKKAVSSVTDADIDKMIETLRKSQGKWETKDGLAVGDGTLARIDFTGRIDGQEFEGGKATDFSLDVDSHSMIPGFTEQIKGHKAGDKFTIKVTFPEDYQAKDLAGKDAEFDISVNAVEERVLPEVNADFMKIYGIKDGDLEKFRSELRSNMERELKRAVNTRNENALVDALLKQYGDFEVADATVKSMVGSLKESRLQQLRQYGLKTLPESLNKDELYHDEAVRQARVFEILGAVKQALKYEQPSDKAVDDLINTLSSAYEDPEDYKKQVREDKRLMNAIRNNAYSIELFDLIGQKAFDGEEQITFDQAVNNK